MRCATDRSGAWWKRVCAAGRIVAAATPAASALRTSSPCVDRNRSAPNGRIYGYGGAPLLKAARAIARPWCSIELKIRRPVSDELRDSRMTSTRGASAGGALVQRQQLPHQRKRHARRKQFVLVRALVARRRRPGPRARTARGCPRGRTAPAMKSRRSAGRAKGRLEIGPFMRRVSAAAYQPARSAPREADRGRASSRFPATERQPQDELGARSHPALCTSTVPPCISTRLLTSDRPMPRPPDARSSRGSSWVNMSKIRPQMRWRDADAVIGTRTSASSPSRSTAGDAAARR